MSSIPTQRLGTTGPIVSRIGLGCMGLSGGATPDNLTDEIIARGIEAFRAALAAGITLYDHADIYGRTACEMVFKHCLNAVDGVRERIVIATKCGIRGGYYDLSTDYILKSLEGSLSRLGIDYVDVYQMHRPDPLAHPRDTAKALKRLLDEGLVKHIAVSNYFPEQLRALETYLDSRCIISNQISLSLARLEPFYEGELPWLGSGILDYCMSKEITPLAYSPVGKGWLTGQKPIPDDHPNKVALENTVTELRKIATDKRATPGQIALAWLLAHPAGIIPLVGSNNPEHIADGARAATITLTREEWYALWRAARGKGVM
ncbi:MAG: aldo/keto reductase [Capsulimonadaceae bacterium]|nr:aldo/keto reductase [Capsulimonadaceae bacterium]